MDFSAVIKSVQWLETIDKAGQPCLYTDTGSLNDERIGELYEALHTIGAPFKENSSSIVGGTSILSISQDAARTLNRENHMALFPEPTTTLPANIAKTAFAQQIAGTPSPPSAQPPNGPVIKRGLKKGW